jgi:hypothetical protein
MIGGSTGINDDEVFASRGQCVSSLSILIRELPNWGVASKR